MSTEVQPDPRVAYRRIVEQLAQRELEAMLGEKDGRAAAAQFALAFRTAAQASPRLYDCTQQSVGQALAMSLLTRLMPGGPMPPIYLIPRQMSRQDEEGRWEKVWELQWQLSWRGLVVLAARAGYRLRAKAVYAGDEFEYEDGIETKLRHVPSEEGEPDWSDFDAAWRSLRGCWVVAHEIDPPRLAGIGFVSRAKIERRRASSDAWRQWEEAAANGGKNRYGKPVTPPPWVQWPEEMALKTALRYAVSRGLVGLDDVGRMAFDHDGLAERPAEETVIEATAAEPAKPAGRSAATGVRSHLGLPAPREVVPGSIEDLVEHGPAPQRQPAPAAAREAIAAPAAQVRQEAAPAPAERAPDSPEVAALREQLRRALAERPEDMKKIGIYNGHGIARGGEGWLRAHVAKLVALDQPKAPEPPREREPGEDDDRDDSGPPDRGQEGLWPE